jgi:hypothetical protein
LRAGNAVRRPPPEDSEFVHALLGWFERHRWQDRCWRGIEARAASGDRAMTRLRDSGAARSVRDTFYWVTSHRAELATHLR